MTHPEDESPQTDEDAAWRDIVAGYGERPAFPDVQAQDRPAGSGQADLVDGTPAEDLSEQPYEATWEDEGHFVPPPPPPLPRPRGIRAAAWFGLFGIPALMLLLLLTGVTPPSPIGLIMIVWFVSGFGYLVATMKDTNDPDRGWDDGAVL